MVEEQRRISVKVGSGTKLLTVVRAPRQQQAYHYRRRSHSLGDLAALKESFTTHKSRSKKTLRRVDTAPFSPAPSEPPPYPFDPFSDDCPLEFDNVGRAYSDRHPKPRKLSDPVGTMTYEIPPPPLHKPSEPSRLDLSTSAPQRTSFLTFQEKSSKFHQRAHLNHRSMFDWKQVVQDNSLAAHRTWIDGLKANQKVDVFAHGHWQEGVIINLDRDLDYFTVDTENGRVGCSPEDLVRHKTRTGKLAEQFKDVPPTSNANPEMSVNDSHSANSSTASSRSTPRGTPRGSPPGTPKGSPRSSRKAPYQTTSSNNRSSGGGAGGHTSKSTSCGFSPGRIHRIIHSVADSDDEDTTGHSSYFDDPFDQEFRQIPQTDLHAYFNQRQNTEWERESKTVDNGRPPQHVEQKQEVHHIPNLSNLSTSTTTSNYIRFLNAEDAKTEDAKADDHSRQPSFDMLYSSRLVRQLHVGDTQAESSLYLLKRMKSFFVKMKSIEEANAKKIEDLVKSEQKKIKDKMESLKSSDYVGSQWTSTLEVMETFLERSACYKTYCEDVELMVIEPMDMFYNIGQARRKEFLAEKRRFAEQLEIAAGDVDRTRIKGKKLISQLFPKKSKNNRDCSISTFSKQQPIINKRRSQSQYIKPHSLGLKITHAIKSNLSSPKSNKNHERQKMFEKIQQSKATSLKSLISSEGKTNEIEDERIRENINRMNERVATDRKTRKKRRMLRVSAREHDQAVKHANSLQKSYYTEELPRWVAQMEDLNDFCLAEIKSLLSKCVLVQNRRCQNVNSTSHALTQVIESIKRDDYLRDVIIDHMDKQTEKVESFQYHLLKTLSELYKIESAIRLRNPFEEQLAEYAHRSHDELDQDIPSPTFHEVFHQKVCCTVFKNFLKRSLCVENLMFYKEVDNYMNIKDHSSDFAMTRSMAIYDKYIADYAPQKVNLASHVVKQIEAQIGNSDCDQKSLFVNSRREAERLMEADSVPKFIRSEEYKGFLDSIRNHVRYRAVSEQDVVPIGAR